MINPLETNAIFLCGRKFEFTEDSIMHVVPRNSEAFASELKSRRNVTSLLIKWLYGPCLYSYPSKKVENNIAYPFLL